MKVKTLLFRKCPNISMLIELSSMNKNRERWVVVDDVVHLSKENFIVFTNNFLTDYEWVENLSGVVLVTDGQNEIVVDNQGYSYARYVGLIVDKDTAFIEG